jgi:hypothetical protein
MEEWTLEFEKKKSNNKLSTSKAQVAKKRSQKI